MGLPATYDISAYLNDTLSLSFIFNNSDGDPIDLSSADIKMQVRKKHDDPVLWTASEGDGITVTGDDDNIISINKIVSDSQISPGIYKYDIQATYSSGVITTYLRGDFTVESDITDE